MAHLIWNGKYDVHGNLYEPDRNVYKINTIEKIAKCSNPNLFIDSLTDTDLEGWFNRLILGDCCQVLSSLTPEFGSMVNLIYLDPPFFTQSKFRTSSKLSKTQRANRVNVLDSANRSSDSSTEAYSDCWADGLDSYLQWLFQTLTLLKDILSEEGSIYLHLDWHASHYAKAIMDEVFGEENFQNDIAWCYREAINSSKRWNRKHDNILFYSKDPSKFYFNPSDVLQPHSPVTLAKYKYEDDMGRYRLMGRGIVGSPIESARDVALEWEQKRPELVYRHYMRKGTYPLDYWNIDTINQASHERTGYPTQKPLSLLERIMLASSKPGDLILDCCCGSGTTVVAAEKLSRRWIAVDKGSAAIETTKQRLTSLENCNRFDILEMAKDALYTMRSDTG